MFGRKDDDEMDAAQRDVHFVTTTEIKPYAHARVDRINAIRDLIRANQNKVLRIRDFKKAAMTSTAPYIIKALMDSGHITRYQTVTGDRGHQYIYTWHDTPKADIKPALDAMTEPVIGAEELQKISYYLRMWQDETASGDDEGTLAIKHLGATQFVKWLKAKHAANENTVTE